MNQCIFENTTSGWFMFAVFLFICNFIGRFIADAVRGDK